MSPQRAGVVPLSLSQEGLWFFEQSAPGTATYNLPEAWGLKGPLNVPVLQQSLNEIVKRHEPLRTAFGAKGGIPFQIVMPATHLPLELIDLRDRDDREAEAARLAARDAQTPFDLTREPLARATLIRLAEEDHLLVINMHHLISDAWSVGAFLRELAALYGAGLSEKPSPLPVLPIEYTNFSLWQREMWHGGYLSEHLDYWNRQLRGSPASLALPVDRPRPAVQSHRGAALFFEWPASLLSGLKELGRQEGMTVFPILLGAFQILLQRYTRQDDIVVGSPFTGRGQMETEQLIGMFVNTHTLRTDLSGDPLFSELLRRVRDTALDASQHQEIPLHHVVRALGSERNLASHALFQAVFGLQDDFSENWSLPGTTASRVDLDSGCAKFEWTVLLTQTSRGLRARFEYNTGLFEAGTVARAARQYETLLHSIVANPRRRISEFAITTPDERKMLLACGVPPTALYERDKCVHEIFAARAQSNPASVALSMEGREMTYSELNRAADSLAGRLQAAGIEAGAVVGLCVERSMEMIVAMLAILKAGAAYLPLDIAYPQSRLAFMLEDAGARFVVTRENLKTALPVAPQQIVCVEDSISQKAAAAPLASNRAPQSTNPAYVMYTSGSTGQPKGAIIPHRGIARLVRDPGYITISARDVFLQFAPITFDASTLEIWGALLNGAKLVILPPHIPSLEELARVIQREKVTTLWLSAGTFNQMVDFHPESLRGLRWLLAGGEALSVQHVLKALAALENGQLVNGYGPTENTTFTCCYTIPKNWDGGASVPIGRPVNNTQVYVLDPRLEPVPAGVPGELYAGGDGLALGYANRNELTAERFVANPFGGESARLYRTGDLVRWREDGQLEFIGRLDNQIKIRGFRIEPGEVTAALLAHPALREAAAAPWTDPAMTRHLVAYIVPAGEGESPSAEELRRFLAAKLPAHMIPSHFVRLKSLPLTRNGKIDHSALPAPKLSAAPAEQEGAPPRTPTETVLGEIWAEMLGRERVGIHENFFNLGGHSLLATQIISRLAQKLGIELPVQVLFEAPTIAALAAAVDNARNASPELAAITRREIEPSRAEKLLARLDDLTDSQVEELLVELEDSEA